MGNGVCSRRQRRIFQCLLLVTVVCGMLYGGMLSYEMHKQLRRTESMALKYQQHQESLSAQLQVVYEHRSRLEKSLQKERLEHKKAKEDYLVYKLESQQSLNKEKQDGNSKLSSLQMQHQMLKNQHDDLKKQFYELQDQHQAQGEDHNRVLGEHREHYVKLQQVKDGEITQLKDSAYNLRQENKQLRKAHHDIHTQLQDAQVRHQSLKAAHEQLALTLEDHKSALAVAQVQVDEYKRLKESMNKGQEQHAGPQPPLLSDAATKSQSHPEEHQETLDHQEEEEEEEEHGNATQPLSDKDGDEERRRELAEEGMAQAGQPQTLEEDLDQQQQQEEEEEGGAEQAAR